MHNVNRASSNDTRYERSPLCISPSIQADEKARDVERAHLKHMTFSDLVDFLHSPDSPVKKDLSKSREGKRWSAGPSTKAAALAATHAAARSRLQEDGAELDLSGLLAKRSYELLSEAMREKGESSLEPFTVTIGADCSFKVLQLVVGMVPLIAFGDRQVNPFALFFASSACRADPVAALTAKVGGTAALAVTELHKLAEVLERANMEKSRLLAGDIYEPSSGQPAASIDMDASSGPDAASGLQSPHRSRRLLRHAESSSDGEDGRLNALRKSRGRLAVGGGVPGHRENVRVSGKV